jgi:hypothetical protein
MTPQHPDALDRNLERLRRALAGRQPHSRAQPHLSDPPVDRTALLQRLMFWRRY